MNVIIYALWIGTALTGLAAEKIPIDEFNVPSFTENNSEETISKKDLPRNTVVEMDPFTVAIPKGWSFLAAGLSQKMTASLTATPTSNIEKDPTYFGLNERRQPPLFSIEERAQKIKKEKKSWATHFEEWNNLKWLVAEYTEMDKDIKKKVFHISAFTVVKGKEYWILAGTPEDRAPEMKNTILEMMKSTSIRGVAPEGATAAAAAHTQIPTIDNRLQDQWKIVSYKMDEGEVLWTEKEAQALVGKTVTFAGNKVDIGETSCQGVAKPVTDKDEERTLLQDMINPCSAASPGGPVMVLARKSCSKKTNFPPYLTLESDNGMVAFGDAVSFCLKRLEKNSEKNKTPAP